MGVIYPWFKFIIIINLTILSSFTPGGFCLTSRYFYPFGTENGDSVVPKGDDGFVSVPLRPGISFPFFNESYSSLWVNMNGAISFTQGVSQYTPDCGSLNLPLITPFWADVDSRNGGDVFYRETRNQNLLQRANQDIRKAFPYLWSLRSSTLFIATWSNVAFYGASSSCGNDPRNSFQVILSTDGTHSFAIFYYGTLQWTTGTASGGNCMGLGGTAAKAGFDFGDGRTFFKLPGSCSSDIMNVAQSSNMNEAGKWIFRIDSALRPGGCTSDYKNSTRLQISPSFVRSLGHMPLRIRGPCLDKSRVVKVICQFHDLKQGVIDVQGFIVQDDYSVVCQVPFLYSNGRIMVNLVVVEKESPASSLLQFGERGYKKTVFTGFVYVMEASPDFTAHFLGKDSRDKLKVNLKWNPKLLSSHMEGEGRGQISNPTQLQVHLIESDGTIWKDSGVLRENVENSGSLTFALNQDKFADLIGFRIAPKFPQIGDDADKKEKENPRRKRGIRFPKLSEMLEQRSLFSTVSSIYETSLMSRIKAHDRCLTWYKNDPGVSQNDLEHCPPLLSQAQVDPRFATQENIWLISQVHDNATASYIQRTPGANGSGRECTYGTNGQLIFGPPQGGAANRYSPVARFGFLPHFSRDILSYHFCCRTGRDDLCRKYYEKRPPSKGTQYVPPRSARAVGDPHIMTFDLTSYSFNGVGEFWMIKAKGGASSTLPGQKFLMQGRMEPLVSEEENGVSGRASVFTAFVMTDGRTKIQVQISSSKLSDFDLILDDDLVMFDDDDQQEGGRFVLPTETATIEKINNTMIVSFSIGLSFTFTANPNALGLTAVASSNIKSSLPDIQGLLGNIDGDSENDLRALDGSLIPVNSTLRKIHYEFGLSWMTSLNETLFVYPEGKNYESYSNPEFEPNLKIPDPDTDDLPQNVVTLCKGSPECLFDYVASGSLSFARQTLESIQTFNESVDTLTQKIDLCDDLSNFENGHVTFSNFFEGSSAFFECDDGADLIGMGSLTCVKDENSNLTSWSGSWPKCSRPVEEFVCPTNSSIYPCTCTANSLSSSGLQILCSGPKVTQTSIGRLFKALKSTGCILKIHNLTVESTRMDQLNLSPLTQSKVKVTHLNIHRNPRLVSIVGPLQKGPGELNLIDVYELNIVGSPLTDEGLDGALSYFSNSMTLLTISETNIHGPGQSQRNNAEPNSIIESESESKSEAEFLPGLSALTNLTYLNLDHNRIRHLEKGAFTFLPKLRFLTISNNLLGEGSGIKLDAFVSPSKSQMHPSVNLDRSNRSLLFIRLSSNGLTPKNLNETTKTPPMPIKLDLTYNQLTHLPASFFKPFFLANPENQVNLRQNPIICNRLTHWLKNQDGADTFQRQVLNVDCRNDPGRTIFTSRLI